jgi:hypothetical protein
MIPILIKAVEGIAFALVSSAVIAILVLFCWGAN